MMKGGSYAMMDAVSPGHSLLCHFNQIMESCCSWLPQWVGGQMHKLVGWCVNRWTDKWMMDT